MSFNSNDDSYVFRMYNQVYNHTNGDVPLGTLHNLHILNQLKIVSMFQRGYVDTDANITIRRAFGEELKLRKMMKEQKESKKQF